MPQAGCPACGAPIELDAERCPYCQQLYPQRVEKKPKPILRHTFRGMPSALMKDLQNTLIQCAEFGSPQELRAVFTNEALAPWRYDVPIAHTQRQLMNLTVANLVQRYNVNGENALTLFLQIMATRYQGDALEGQLRALADAVAGLTIVEPI